MKSIVEKINESVEPNVTEGKVGQFLSQKLGGFIAKIIGGKFTSMMKEYLSEMGYDLEKDVILYDDFKAAVEKMCEQFQLPVADVEPAITQAFDKIGDKAHKKVAKREEVTGDKPGEYMLLN